MKTLITGGTGLVGSHFTKGIKVSSKDYNLLHDSEVEQMFKDHHPEVVIHTAGRVGGLGANMNYLGDFFYENIKINTSVLHQAKEYGVKKFVSFTSTCVFPSKVEYPLTEDKIHLGPPHSSNYAYAHAKRMLDIQGRAYNDQFGTHYFSVIPVNIYGPHDNFHLENSHVVPALIHKIFLAKKNNTDLILWGTGKPLREFIYVKDITNLTETLVEKYEGTKPIILSTSEETSIKDITYLLCDLIGFKNKVIFDSNKPDGQFRKPSDNSYLKSIIGDYQFTPLEEGLKETVDWFISAYPNIRK